VGGSQPYRGRESLRGNRPIPAARRRAEMRPPTAVGVGTSSLGQRLSPGVMLRQRRPVISRTMEMPLPDALRGRPGGGIMRWARLCADLSDFASGAARVGAFSSVIIAWV
jgi:hypothetical protein